MGISPKDAVLALLDQPLLGRLLGRLRPDRTAILVLHHFASTDGTRSGHDPARLRATLASLRASGVALLDLDEAVRARLEPTSAPRRPSVVITIDDCYPDALEIGAPILREFDCPATGFIVPHMIDGVDWFWWDQIDWLLRQTTHRSLAIEIGDVHTTHQWTDDPSRRQVVKDLVERIKRVSTVARLSTIAQLAQLVDVPLPETPPAEFRVASWDALRAAESQGLRFGAHTLSHPVLSRCTDEEAKAEIHGSITRVDAELANPSRVFCYPVGRAEDFGPREMQLVAASGMLGAVSAIPRLVQPNIAQALGEQWRWQVPRAGYDERRGAVARFLLL